MALTPELSLTLTGDNPVVRHTARRWLDRAFAAISPEDQTLVTLYELEGWPITELAELFGKTEGALKVRLHRARRRMKHALLEFSRAGSGPDAEQPADKENPWTATKPSVD